MQRSARGQTANGSISLPTLTAFESYSYIVRGEFTTPAGDEPGPVSGVGHVEIVRSDGARMWGQGSIILHPAEGGLWDLEPHCSLG